MSRQAGWLAGGLFALVGLCATPSLARAEAVPVKIEKRPGGTFEMLRGGQPFFIKGAGGQSYLQTLKESGGNSIRTWGADNLGPILDRAHSLGLTVTVGIWLGHPRHGFRYDDEGAVRRQFEMAQGVIRQYKDHPAVLMWGLGNEMEADGKDVKIWNAVNDISRMAHKEDPNHPTMTVIAELGEKNVKLEMFRKHCPEIDVLGVNSYAGVASLGERLEKAKFNRPFVITEFGPAGFWEVESSPWKAALEPTSTAKAETYRNSYARAIAGQKGHCLGSFAFLWGNKQEATSTWFGLFLPSGEKTAAVDVLTEAWTGKKPANLCPKLAKFSFAEAGKSVKPGAPLQATVEADDPDGDPLSIRWEVRSESTDRHEGGDRESEPLPHPESIVKAVDKTVAFRAPGFPGPCRLFVFIYDGKGGAATANVVFNVEGEPSIK